MKMKAGSVSNKIYHYHGIRFLLSSSFDEFVYANVSLLDSQINAVYHIG